MANDFLNGLEELVLLSIVVLHPDAYAYAIKKEINDQAGQQVSLASIHTVLYRMENKGWVQSELGGQSEKRGGRSKRLFTATSAGTEMLKSTQIARNNLWGKINTI